MEIISTITSIIRNCSTMFTKVKTFCQMTFMTNYAKVGYLKNKENSRKIAFLLRSLISNGNRTGWSPIWSVIIRVITKLDDCTARVQFAYQNFEYRANWTTGNLITN